MIIYTFERHLEEAVDIFFEKSNQIPTKMHAKPNKTTSCNPVLAAF